MAFWATLILTAGSELSTTSVPSDTKPPGATVISTIPALVTVGTGAGPAQRRAAQDVANVLSKISGGNPQFKVENAPHSSLVPQIAVGFDAATNLLEDYGISHLRGLGAEGFVAMTTGNSIVLSGGNASQRGDLYATNFFLELLGVRFLATDTTLLPSELPSKALSFYERHVPSFEYRQQFSFQTTMDPTMPQFNLSLDFDMHLGNNANDATSSGSPPVFHRLRNLERGGTAGVFASKLTVSLSIICTLENVVDTVLHGVASSTWPFAHIFQYSGHGRRKVQPKRAVQRHQDLSRKPNLVLAAWATKH